MATSKLSSTDRRQLCKITQGRFEILREQISERYNDVQQQVREKVVADHEADIKTVRSDLVSIKEQQDAAKIEYDKKVATLDVARNKIIADAADRGLTVTKGYRDEIGQVAPANITNIVDEKITDFRKQRNEAHSSLRATELTVLENISVAGLESDEAKDFLGLIPDVEKLLPAPNLPELQTSNS